MDKMHKFHISSKHDSCPDISFNSYYVRSCVDTPAASHLRNTSKELKINYFLQFPQHDGKHGIQKNTPFRRLKTWLLPCPMYQHIRTYIRKGIATSICGRVPIYGVQKPRRHGLLLCAVLVTCWSISSSIPSGRGPPQKAALQGRVMRKRSRNADTGYKDGAQWG